MKVDKGTKLEKLPKTKRPTSIRSDWRVSELWQLGLIGDIINKLKDEENEKLSDRTNR